MTENQDERDDEWYRNALMAKFVKEHIRELGDAIREGFLEGLEETEKDELGLR